jgi:hypothetical protein
MAKVIGVDPDSDRHGVAVYRDGNLSALAMASSIEIVEHGKEPGTLVVIENVMANQFVYARNRHGSKSAQSKIAMHIGRCQQAQVELQRLLDHNSIKYVLVKPTKGNWAKNKSTFERLTGWTGRSNEDTRAAAFFGYMYANKRATA